MDAARLRSVKGSMPCSMLCRRTSHPHLIVMHQYCCDAEAILLRMHACMHDPGTIVLVACCSARMSLWWATGWTSMSSTEACPTLACSGQSATWRHELPMTA